MWLGSRSSAHFSSAAKNREYKLACDFPRPHKFLPCDVGVQLTASGVLGVTHMNNSEGLKYQGFLALQPHGYTHKRI